MNGTACELSRQISRGRAGQPVIALCVLLLLWGLARVVLWKSPFPNVDPLDFIPGFEEPKGTEEVLTRSVDSEEGDVLGASEGDNTRSNLPRLGLSVSPPGRMFYNSNPGIFVSRLASQSALAQSALTKMPGNAADPHGDKRGGNRGGGRESSDSATQAASTSALLSAFAPSSASVPMSVPALTQSRDGRPSPWSFDGWLLLRGGGTGRVAAGGGASPATYGGSQAGGVLRYSLAPDHWRRPKAYIRAVTALDGAGGGAGGGDGDVAAGLSARPIKGLPLSMQAEMRLSRSANSTETRPAIMAITEFPPTPLPHGFQAEIYGQFGYVGGNFATPFADGQARIDGEVAKFDLGKLRAGAGAWGGAQNGAARLDIGPSASVTVPIGEGAGRLSLDYRHRVAGDADPPSGVTLTLSTGF